MRRLFASRAAAATTTGILVLLVAGGGYGIAAVTGGTINACVHRRSHVLYTGKCGKGDGKLSWNKAGIPGAVGPRGPAGAQGQQGAQGVNGSTGPVGPTAGATNSPGGTPVATPNSWGLSGTATITTTTSSKLLIWGVANNDLFVCGTSACTQTFGLYIDGQPVAGSAESITLGANGDSNARTIVTTGQTGLLAPGTHTVKMQDNAVNVINAGSNTPRVWVIAVGG